VNANKTILLVEDSENDRIFMRHAFKKSNFNWPLQEVLDGEEAIAYLRGDAPYSDRKQFPLPVVMLLDLNIPKKSGFDVLQWARAQEAFKPLHIIVLTASTRPDDVKEAYCLGANSFLVKPATVEELALMIGCLRDWLRYNQLALLDEGSGR
jgi:CheY-like chemotaxis protein